MAVLREAALAGAKELRNDALAALQLHVLGFAAFPQASVTPIVALARTQHI